VSGDEGPKKLKQNVNIVCILTLMVSFQDGSIYDMSSLSGGGAITKLGTCLRPKPEAVTGRDAIG